MNRYLLVVTLLLYIGCGGEANRSEELFSSPLPIYNQAYQENFESDTIDKILKQAHDAYVLVDPFEKGVVPYIATIQANNNQVGGYISVGTGEDWREDFSELAPYLSSEVWDAWKGEYYVSQTTTGIEEVMRRRIDKMSNWGIDWVEFDNMDWWDEETKKRYNLELTQHQATAYINNLCAYVHQKGMKCMAKNSVEGFALFDGVLYESYPNRKNWWDFEGMQQFLAQKKLVIINHYNEANCDDVYEEYRDDYKSEAISFICEDTQQQAYRHYNQ